MDADTCARRSQQDTATTLAATTTPVSSLLDEIITDHIFGFVGVGHYRFVAGTNRKFRDLYTAFLKHTNAGPSVECSSTYRSIVESVSRTELLLKETPGDDVVCLLKAAYKYNKCPVGMRLPRKRVLDFIAVNAACSGSLKVLHWACCHGYFLDVTCCYAAAAGGHLELLQWARRNGCEWNSSTCSAAARGGHLKVLKWARQKGCDWDSHTCSEAASGGHLEVLQWARRNGCEWNSFTCSGAAKFGHLECLQWAYENGCEWNKSTCGRAIIKFGHLHVLQWARKKNLWQECM